MTKDISPEETVKPAGKPRIEYLDLIKGAGIMLVIIFHCPSESPRNILDGVVTTFFMQIFFVLSGIMLSLTGESGISLKQSFIKKVKGLLLPYLYFSIADTIICILRYLATGKTAELPAILRIYTYQFFSFQGISVLWFLSALFLAEVIFSLCLRAGNSLPVKEDEARNTKVYLRYTLPFILSLVVGFFGVYLIGLIEHRDLFLNLSIVADRGISADEIKDYRWWGYGWVHSIARGMVMTVFVCAGYYGALLWKWIKNLSLPLQFKGYSAVLLELGFSLVLTATHLLIYRENGRVNSAFCIFGSSALLYYLMGITSTAAALFLARSIWGLLRVPPLAFILRIFTYFGKNSLIVMATHLDWYLVLAAYKLLLLLPFFPPERGHFNGTEALLRLLILIGVLLLEIPIITVFRMFKKHSR